MRRKVFAAIARISGALSAVLLLGVSAERSRAGLVLVDEGVSRAPIVVAAELEALAFTRGAAEDLADYIEKISGARLEILFGKPDPIPEPAIWVGVQPVLETLFPEVDLAFQHPEEILIAANERHLVIAGRDRWDPDRLTISGGNWRTGRQLGMIEGMQAEYGTANAVYTFIQNYLDVCWLWPGELGEDVIPRETIAFAPFVYRHHPQFRERALFLYSVLGDNGKAGRWTQLQRLRLDSLMIPAGHPTSTWWRRFHEDHPEYFALQPDGTRHFPRYAKLCKSNPAVWARWLKEWEAQIEENPLRTVFSADPADGHSGGICICADCLAWDHPEGAPWRYTWQGLAQEYVAMTDRYYTYWSKLADLLQERFPDRDYWISASTYGPSSPLPVAATLPENFILGDAGWFPFTTEANRQSQKAGWLERTQRAPCVRHRPNLWWFGGGAWGFPEIAMTKWVEDFRFLTDHGTVGLCIDTAWETWATQGPQYYLMAQLVWDPDKDAEAVLADYYRRGFGPAAESIAAYWRLFESATERLFAHPDYTHNIDVQIRTLFPQIYDDALLARAAAYLDAAAAAVDGEPEIYRQRVDFVRVGYDYVRLLTANIPLMQRVRDSEGRDADAVRQVDAHWAEIERMDTATGGLAINFNLMRHRMHGGYRNANHNFTPTDEQREAAEMAGDTPIQLGPAEAAEAARAIPAAPGDWELVFQDDFDRDDLGDDWQVIEGDWKVSDGALRGNGTLMSARPLPEAPPPGFQRMVFEAETDAQAVALLPGVAPTLSAGDISSFLHAPADDDRGVLSYLRGYFFQFGGAMNTRNRLMRAGLTLIADPERKTLIVPGKRHRILVENDEGVIRLFVDDELLLEATEQASILGGDFGHFGFYFYTRMKVHQVRVYVKRLPDDLI